MKPLALLLVCLSLALPARAAPPSLAAAEALVRAQYAPGVDASADGAARLYEPVLAGALMSTSAATGADLGFDPRYSDIDWKMEQLVLTTTAEPGGAKVAARFTNFGRPVQIDWRLIPAPDSPAGWRVEDISAPAQNDQEAWDLRDLLLIPAKP
jgi:hypothetical protein